MFSRVSIPFRCFVSFPFSPLRVSSPVAANFCAIDDAQLPHRYAAGSAESRAPCSSPNRRSNAIGFANFHSYTESDRARFDVCALRAVFVAYKPAKIMLVLREWTRYIECRRMRAGGRLTVTSDRRRIRLRRESTRLSAPGLNRWLN